MISFVSYLEMKDSESPPPMVVGTVKRPDSVPWWRRWLVAVELDLWDSLLKARALSFEGDFDGTQPYISRVGRKLVGKQLC